MSTGNDTEAPEFPENGLLPEPSDLPGDLTVRPGASPEELLRDAVAGAMEIVEGSQVVWTASLDGELIPPPAAHILDSMVRVEFAGYGPEVEAEMMLHLRAGTVAVLDRLPSCDLCSAAGFAGVTARYDAPTTQDGAGLMAFLCPDCYRRRSTGRLGGRRGRYLLLHTEVPEVVLAGLERARAYWRQRIDGEQTPPEVDPYDS